MERTRLLREVSRRLGRRKLVWAGLRGDDIEPLADLPNLAAAFSILSRYSRRNKVNALAYEDLTGRRPDPETWDIDDHLDDPATQEYRRSLLRELAGDSALLPYRPSQFLSAITFARWEQCWNLGMFGAHQSAFEHKPWVETAVAGLGVPHIEWRYVADEEQLQARALVRAGDVMLRRTRSSGGEGMVRVRDARRLAEHWPHIPEAFASVSAYLPDGLPVNVGATVWKDTVTVHHPSAQLIGIPGLVGREFGYCGNDFGRMRDEDPAIIDEIEDSTVRIGKWLWQKGYRGSFGVDYLVHSGHALFTEVNARFQGSTHLSCRLSIEAGEACLMLEHLAAHLDIEGPKQARPLREVVAELPDLSQVVFHWNGAPGVPDTVPLTEAVRRHGRTASLDVLPAPEIEVAPGASIARWSTRRRVTDTGYRLLPELRDLAKLPPRLAGSESSA